MLEKDENGNCIGKCAGCENAYIDPMFDELCCKYNDCVKEGKNE